MTEEQHATAGRVLEQIRELKSAKTSIENAISARQREMDRRGRYGGFAEWMAQRFATFRMDLNKDKASVAVRYEGSPAIEFPIDEQFVTIITGYLDLRIKQKEHELAEI